MNVNQRRVHLDNVSYILAFSFLFPLLSVLLRLPFGGIGFVVSFLAVLWLFLQHRNMFKPILFSPVSLWLILMVYHFANLIFNVGNKIDMTLFRGNMLPCFILYLSAYIAYYDFDLFLKRIMQLYFSFIVLSVIAFITGQTFDFDGRIGIEGFHPNILGQYAGYYLMFFSIYIIRFKLTLIKKIILLLPPLILIFYSESRNSFVILVFAAISFIIGYGSKNKLKASTILKTLIVIILFYLIGEYTLNNTSLGERLLGGISGESSQVRLQYSSGTIFDTILGERIMYYTIGYDLFTRHPILGIGLWNFVDFNPFELPLHSEYMVHLAEGGIVGFILYLFFIIGIIKLFVSFKHRNYFYYQLLICFICILINGITARIFPYTQFFCVFGAIIGYLLADRNNRYYENSI